MPSHVFKHRAAAAQFGELPDEPRERVPIRRFETNRDIDFNADSWREAGQGAVFSIQRYSLASGEILGREFALSEAF